MTPPAVPVPFLSFVWLYAMSNRYHHITDEAKEEIRRVYQEEVGMGAPCNGYGPVRRLAKRLNLPRWKVTRTAINMGLIARQKKESAWSARELKIMETNVHRSPETIQRYLKKEGYNRTTTGIVIKRKKMRMLQNMDGQSATSLAECFGVDAKTVQHWIKKDYLRAERREMKHTPQHKGDTYYIRDRWVKDFVIDNLAVVDFRKADKWWLVSLLTGEDL